MVLSQRAQVEGWKGGPRLGVEALLWAELCKRRVFQWTSPSCSCDDVVLLLSNGRRRIESGSGVKATTGKAQTTGRAFALMQRPFPSPSLSLSLLYRDDHSWPSSRKSYVLAPTQSNVANKSLSVARSGPVEARRWGRRRMEGPPAPSELSLGLNLAARKKCSQLYRRGSLLFLKPPD